MAPVPNSVLALNRQQLIDENQQLMTEKQTLQNEISQAQDTLASLQSDISVTTQNLTRYKSEENAISNDINQLKGVQEQLKTNIGLQDDTGNYPVGSLSYKKTELENSIAKLEKTGQKREEEIAQKTQQLDEEYQKHKAKIEKNIKIINSVKDFKEESVKNMRFYGWSMLFASLLALILGIFSLCNISEALGLFSEQLNLINASLMQNGWNWLYAALSIVVVKIPNALLFVGILFVLYKIFNVLFNVYEKINMDKRKISAIEALITHMNEQSVAIILGREIDFKNKEDIENAKADLKWQILSEYFSKVPEDSVDSDNAIKRENQVLREVFLNKRKAYGVSTPVGGARIEQENNIK